MRDDIHNQQVDPVADLMDEMDINEEDDDNVLIFEELEDSDDFDSSLNDTSGTLVEDDAKIVFKSHSAPVFGLALHPELYLASSGGEDDTAFVFDTETNEIYHKITHLDTVTDVHFSYDGQYLATADMSGYINVLKITQENLDANEPEKKSYKFNKVYCNNIGDLEWMLWHFAANVIFIGSKSGEIYMIRIPTGDCKIFAGVGRCVSLGGVTEDGTKFAAVYGDAIVKLWDAKTCQAIFTHTNSPSNGADELVPCSLAVCRDAPIFAFGCTDGRITFYTYTGCVGQLYAETSVESLEFASAASGLKVCVSVSLSGQIAIWDYVHMQLRNVIPNPEQAAITTMKFMSEHLFAVATMDGDIYIHDIRSEERLCTLIGHVDKIYELRYNKKNNLLASTSEDTNVRIFCPKVEF